jgi:pyridoxamine 5'-phosphate oxidase
MPIDPEALDPDPMMELAAWVNAAEAAGHRLAQGFALATVDADGRPSVRFVLLRGIGSGGLEFFTNRDSLKGRDLAANPRAAAAFWWEQTNRQIRVSGQVSMLDDAETTAYWDTRPRGHQLAAWASAQSQPVDERTTLEANVDLMTTRFADESAVPLPPFWSGYRLVAEVIEFWESREDRLHDRIEFRRAPEGTWERRRLQP